jgi:7,8-dihydro-6-hydroxymethylpterin-pyrophosphokinase
MFHVSAHGDLHWSSQFAVVALGSNLGDSARLLREAADQIARLSARPLSRSSLWESTPVDCPAGSPH